MENTPKSDGPNKTLRNNKIAALSLATCVLLGIVGFEVAHEKKDEPTPFHFQNYSLSPINNQNEQLQVELNHSYQNLNQLKRQLFVRNNAPLSAFNRKLQQDFNEKEKKIKELSQEIALQEHRLTEEKNKVAMLESSLAALAELIEIQKISKERFHETLKQSTAAKEQISLEYEKLIALNLEELENLKSQIFQEVYEKQSLLDIIEASSGLHQESILQMANILDQISIENTIQSLVIQNIYNERKEYFDSLQEKIASLESDLEIAQIKYENEIKLKENVNQALLTLINKTSVMEAQLAALNKNKLIQEEEQAKSLLSLAEKGANLEEELAFEKTLYIYDKEKNALKHITDLERLNQDYQDLSATCKKLESEYITLQRKSLENNNDLNKSLLYQSDLEENLLFEKLENKLAKERMTIELEDISYALISAEHQRDLMKRNLDDHFAVFNAERQEMLEKINFLNDELEKQATEFKQLKDNQISIISELEESIIEAEIAVRETLLAFEKKSVDLSHANQQIELLENEIKQQSKALSYSTKAELELKQDLENAIHEVKSLSLEIENLESALNIKDLKLIETQDHQKISKEEMNIKLTQFENALEVARIALERTADDLEKEVQQLKDEHMHELTKKDVNIHYLQQEIEQIKDVHLAEIAQLEEIKTQIVLETEEKSRQIHKEIQEVINAKNELSIQYDEAIKSIEQLEKEIQDKERTINFSEEQLDHLKAEMEHVRNSLLQEKRQREDFEKEIKNLEQMNEDKIKNESVEASLQKLNDTLEEQTFELNQLELVRDALQYELNEGDDN